MLDSKKGGTRHGNECSIDVKCFRVFRKIRKRFRM